jgi:hypothetical protein
MIVRHLLEALSVTLMVVVVLSFSGGRASRVVRLWRDDLINDLIDLTTLLQGHMCDVKKIESPRGELNVFRFWESARFDKMFCHLV